MYNPRTNFDLFCFSRGLIAGSIIVSAPASDYKIWISIILGAIGGAIVVASSQFLHKFRIDDPLQIAQTHGFPALVSLVMVIFFHRSEGIFFTNIHNIVSDQALAIIINVFGANILGALAVILWTALFAIPFFILIKKWFLRVDKADELIGLDAAQYILGKEDCQNLVQAIITEFYPENTIEFLRKKQILLEKQNQKKEGNKHRMSVEQLKRLKQLVETEMNDAIEFEKKPLN